jgi:hypothetical protein
VLQNTSVGEAAIDRKKLHHLNIFPRAGRDLVLRCHADAEGRALADTVKTVESFL